MQFEFEFYRDQPARPARPERLVFLLFPDAATSIRVSKFAECFIRENRLSGSRIKTERLHLSLQHVGDYKRLRDKFIYAAQRAAAAVAMPPFDVTFPSITSFERDGDFRQRRPLVLLGEGDALSELHKTLGAAMDRNGLKAGNGFTPHMTLLYGSRPIPLQAIEPIRFAVKEFALVHSELWLTRYNVIDRWLLNA